MRNDYNQIHVLASLETPHCSKTEVLFLVKFVVHLLPRNLGNVRKTILG